MQSEQKEADRYSFNARHPRYKMFEVDSRLRYFKPHAIRTEKTFAEEISSGLDKKESKFISPKFFYDNVGSELFEAICSAPEYYLTRTEISILEGVGDDLGSILAGACSSSSSSSGDAKRSGCNDVSSDIRLVELGSGSSVKTRIILDILLGLQNRVEYFPIDISDILAQSSERLLADYSRLKITGIIDTYEGGLKFRQAYDKGRSLIIFLGSSYGNISPADGVEFLRKVRSAMRPGDLFLMGLDMVKDVDTLESAYNDSAGITARFNLNVLSRINSELDANFNLDNFAHRAVYNADKQRIEMHLESLCAQTVTISKLGIELRLENGELVHTEHSYKYEKAQIQDMLDSAGFEQVRMWSDPDEYFVLVLVTAAATATANTAPHSC